MKKRILLLYISENSGHHHASLAIEGAFYELFGDNVEIRNLNSFHYTNPILEKIINKTYMSVIKRTPEIWGYLYDNPKIVKMSQGLRESIHRYNSNKMKDFLDEFMPDAVICTQAFPCGIVADCKKTHRMNLLIAGVLTDYAPHSYWLYDNVDLYFVPSEETKEKLISSGISKNKIKVTGIPIDPKFRNAVDKKAAFETLGLSDKLPILLLMGGSQGIGPVKEIVKILNSSKIDFQIIVVTGDNKKLYAYLKKAAPRFSKKTVIFQYAKNIYELMEISSLLIGKPGGITVSEALAKGLPLLIVNPIPGQEMMNTDHLVKKKVAIRVGKLQNVEVFVEELLSKPLALKNMQKRAIEFSARDSAFDIAKAIFERI